MFRQYRLLPGPLTEPGTRIALVSDDPEEVHRSPAELAVLAPPAAVCRELARRVAAARRRRRREPRRPPASARAAVARASRCWPCTSWPRWPSGCRADAIVLEEAPVDRPELHARLPARRPLGYLSAAMGVSASRCRRRSVCGWRCPHRPVVAVVGDGSALYGMQALWSAAHYRVGPLFVVLSNGGYVVMDRLAERHGGAAPWPAFPEIEVAAIARGFGCPARRIATHEELVGALDEVVPALAGGAEPLLLDVAVAPTQAFAP